MESATIKKITNHDGQINCLELQGMLVVFNSQKIKDEFVSVVSNAAAQIDVVVSEVDEIDLSFIQLIVAFTSQLTKSGVGCRLHWNLTDEQRSLLENVGMINELFN